MSIEIVRAEGYDDLSRRAADLVAGCIGSNPTARVLIATGRTPIGAYRVLADGVTEGTLDASGITAYQLDEYLGLGPDDRRSLGGWAVETFVRPLRIADERFVRLPLAGDGALDEYDRRIRGDGGYDLSILGIGENGHLGFNEPPSDASTASRVVELTPGTIDANASYWGDAADVPRRAATVGLRPLLESARILLLASGARKREILERALFRPVTPDVPASCLQHARGEVVVIADRDAFPTGSNGAST
ncbi:MAG: 6-phosphogluconolactonase [Actinomycetota bacterium]